MAYRIVVADSSISVRRAVETAFSESGFKVYTFKDGLETLKSLPELKPDAVLLSLSLPSKDGYELGLFLRTQDAYKQTALILLRGAFEPLDSQRLSPIDYDLLVRKPIDSEKLAQSVREAIERKKDIPFMPEEPFLEEAEQPSSPLESPPLMTPEGMADMEEKIREAVKKEVQGMSLRLEKMVKDLVSAEFRKWMVEELKGLKPKR
ncbi:MAG: response regulator [Candidatus Aminicenantales bacterium]